MTAALPTIRSALEQTDASLVAALSHRLMGACHSLARSDGRALS